MRMETVITVLFLATTTASLNIAGAENADRGRVSPRRADRGKQRANEVRGRRDDDVANRVRQRSSELRRGGALRQRDAQPQAGTGRVGRDTIPGNARGAARSAEVRGRRERSSRNTRERDVDRPHRTNTGETRVTGEHRTRAENAERLLNLRLKSIAHIREVAERNGNQRLMDSADRLEKLARSQYDRMMAKVETVERESEIPPSNNGSDAPAADVARRAQQNGRGFGKLTAEEARRLRREFGRNKADNVGRNDTTSDNNIQQTNGTAESAE